MLNAFLQALHNRRLMRQHGLIHHSDNGLQHVSIKYSEPLTKAGVEPPVGNVGDSYDNALAFCVEKAESNVKPEFKCY